MKLLVTCFTPFGLRALPLPGFSGNRSRAICERLHQAGDLAGKIQIEMLEVAPLSAHVTSGALASFCALLNEKPSPTGVLMLGEVQSLTVGIRVEPSAHFLDLTVSGDFSRNAAQTAAVRGVAERNVVAGHVSGSSGIGRQGCNQMYGVAQNWARAQQPVAPVLFIHCGFRDTLETETFQVKRYLWQMLDTVTSPSRLTR
jgi:hypothetical protein